MIPSNLNSCRFEIKKKNNKQTRESTALSVAYNIERCRRGWEGIVGRRCFSRHESDFALQAGPCRIPRVLFPSLSFLFLFL
jgi:hypothetical protein